MNKELHKIQKKEPILIINDNDYREFCNEKARKVINFYKNHSEYNKIIIFPGFHPEEFGLPASSLLLSDKIYPFSTGFDVGCGYLILIVYDIDPIKMNKITKKLENSNEISKIFNKNIENSSWIIKKMNKITKKMLQNEFSKKFYFVAKKIIWNNFGELNPGGHFIEFHILEKIYEESLKSLNNNSLLLIVHNGSGNYGKKLLVLLAQMFGYFEGNKLNLQDIPKIEDKIHQVYIPFWNHSISRGKNGNKNWLMFLELYKNILEYSFLNRLYIAEQVIDFLSQEFNHSIKFDFVSDSIHSSIFVEKFNHNRIAIHRSGLTKISKKFQYYYIGSNPGEKSFLIKPLQKAKDTFYSIPHGTSKVHNTKYFKNIKSVITPLLEKGIIKLAIKLKPLISIKRVGSSKKDVICTKW